MKLTLLPELTSSVMRSRAALMQALACFSGMLDCLTSFSMNCGCLIVGPAALVAYTTRGRDLGRLASGDDTAATLDFASRELLEGFSALIMGLHEVDLVSKAKLLVPGGRWTLSIQSCLPVLS